MGYDLFALWDENAISMDDMVDVHSKVKYLLTRDKQDARRTYQRLIKQYRFRDMSRYCLSRDAISVFPKFSFLFQFRFTLATPFLSRDEQEFHICDNPIRQDKAFKVPMISGTTWKGNLRWTAMKRTVDAFPQTISAYDLASCFDLRGRLVRVFGHEKDRTETYLDEIIAERLADAASVENIKTVHDGFNRFLRDKGYVKEGVDGRKSRLSFYPTFFDRIGVEVINPHDRKTKAGTLPIFIECVPEGTQGAFTLLYVPFDLIGRPHSDVAGEVLSDLSLLFHSLRDMMLTYGFSAKKSTGFGISQDDVAGTFEMSGYPIFGERADVQPANIRVDDSNPFAKLRDLKIKGSEPVLRSKDNTFSDFDELERIIKRVGVVVREDKRNA